VAKAKAKAAGDAGTHSVAVLKRTEDTEGAVVVASQNPADSLLAVAVQRGASLEELDKLMTLQERWEDREAQKGYVLAMAAFKKDPPEILKTAHVEYVNGKGETVEWDHAQLGEICEAINKGLSENDLFSDWDLDQSEKGVVKVTCVITHAMGHSKQVTMEGPPDTSGGKDALNAVSSTNTRLQRLTLLAAAGLAAKGMDKESPNDDAGVALEFITEDQAGKLSALCKKAKLSDEDIARLLTVLEVEELSTLLQKDYIAANNLLEETVARYQRRECKA